MNKNAQDKLAAQGWVKTTVEEFFELSPTEMQFIELKLRLANMLKQRRKEENLTQGAFAKRIQSSQSRVAKMEAGDPSVSIDLLVRSLFALGVDISNLGYELAKPQ